MQVVAGRQLQSACLELGGKNPTVVREAAEGQPPSENGPNQTEGNTTP
jgi:hypothetical protein